MPRLSPGAPKSSKDPKARRWLLIPLALLALPLALKALGVQTANRAATSPDSADASLRTRFYAATPAQVGAQVLEAVPELSTWGRKWRVASSGQPDKILCEVPVLAFTDDLAVTIEAHGSGSRVDVASAARVGQGDFGENARHIRQLLGALDGRLPRGN